MWYEISANIYYDNKDFIVLLFSTCAMLCIIFLCGCRRIADSTTAANSWWPTSDARGELRRRARCSFNKYVVYQYGSFWLFSAKKAKRDAAYDGVEYVKAYDTLIPKMQICNYNARLFTNKSQLTTCTDFYATYLATVQFI